MRSFPLLPRSSFRRPASRACLAAALGLALPGANTLVAQFYVGPDNGDWFTPANWDSGVPTSDSTPIIDGNLTAVIASPGVSVDTLLLGFFTGGRLQVQNGASGSSNSVQFGGESRLTVTGSNSSWTSSYFSIDALGDDDHLVVSNGGLVTVDSLTAGSFDGVRGKIVVTGTDSRLVDTSDPGYWGLTLGSAFGSSGSLTISDGGSVVSSGTVALGYSGTGDVLLTGAGSSWTVNNTINLGYDTTGVGTLTVADGATGSSTGLYVGHYYGVGDVTITGSGSQWTTDDFTLSNGTLVLENGGVLRLGDGTGYGLNYATTHIGNGTTAGRIEGDWLNYGSIVLDHTDTATVFTGYVTNLGTIEKNGAGTSIFAGDYASLGVGSVTLNAGTLQFGNGSELGDIDGTFTSASGATLAFDSSSNLSFTGVLSGSGSLLQSGTGRLTLTGNHTYTGSTTIEAGTLSISADGRLGTAPASATPGHLVLDGGTLRTTATMTLNARRGIALGEDGGTLQPTTGTLTYGGIVAGPGGLTKSGNGTLLLSGDNTHAGGTTLASGTLQIGHNHALGTGTFALNNGTVQASGGARTIGNAIVVGGNVTFSGSSALNFTGTLALGAATRQFTVSNTGGTTFGGVISGTGGLTKAGAGTLILSGANLYSGNTTVSAGTLRTANPSGSAFGSGNVTVNAGATLTGSGAFTGALTNHGTFSPGDDFSLLTISNFTQSATGTLILELGGLGRGLDHDALNITGTFSAGGTLRVLLSESFAPTNGDYFDLLDWTSFNGTFAQLDLPSLGGGLFWDDSAFYTSGVLTVTGLGSPIPEPSTYAILAGTATLALAAWRRRLAKRRVS